MKRPVYLETLTDKQRTLLMKLAYLELGDQYSKFGPNFECTISKLYELLIYKGAYNSINSSKIQNAVEVINELIQNGMGDWKVVDWLKVGGIKRGRDVVNAIAIEDGNGDRGMSFAIPNVEEMIRDKDDEFGRHIMFDDSNQVKVAKQFFEKYKSESGRNFLLGHSIGGNLAAQIYMESPNEIMSVHTINMRPIEIEEQDPIRRAKQEIALADGSKFKCDYIGGDVFGMLKKPDCYSHNVMYIKNNRRFKDSFFGNYLLDSISFKENGDFDYVPKEKAYENRKIKSLRPEEYKGYISAISKNPKSYKTYEEYLKKLEKTERKAEKREEKSRKRQETISSVKGKFKDIGKSIADSLVGKVIIETGKRTGDFLKDLWERINDIDNGIVSSDSRLLLSEKHTDRKENETEAKKTTETEPDIRDRYKLTKEQALELDELSRKLINKMQEPENVNQARIKEEPDEPGKL